MMRLLTILSLLLMLTCVSCNKNSGKDKEGDKTESNETGKRSFESEPKEDIDDASSDAEIQSSTEAIDKAYDLMRKDDLDQMIDVLSDVTPNASMSAETMSKAAVTHIMGLCYVITNLSTIDKSQAKEVFEIWLNDAVDAYNMALQKDSDVLARYISEFETTYDIDVASFLNEANKYYEQLYGN